MDKAKWLQFTKTLDIILTKYNILHKSTQILLTDDTDYNRNLLSDI